MENKGKSGMSVFFLNPSLFVWGILESSTLLSDAGFPRATKSPQYDI